MGIAHWLIFLRIGCTGFGGLGNVLAQLERELVTRRGLLTAEDITEALTYTKLLPGSTVVQVVSYLGYRMGGWPGSALATLAFLLPAIIVMLALAALYSQLAVFGPVQAALRGLNAVVVGLLVVTTYRLGRSSIKTWLGLVIAGGALVLALLLNLPLVIIVIGAGLLGVGTHALEARRGAA